jgi:hypothetical protein
VAPAPAAAPSAAIVSAFVAKPRRRSVPTNAGPLETPIV